MTNGGAIWPDGLQGEAVQWSRCAVAVLLELHVQVVYEGSEGRGKQQWQLEAGTFHVHIVAPLDTIDNLVYDMGNIDNVVVCF